MILEQRQIKNYPQFLGLTRTSPMWSIALLLLLPVLYLATWMQLLPYLQVVEVEAVAQNFPNKEMMRKPAVSLDDVCRLPSACMHPINKCVDDIITKIFGGFNFSSYLCSDITE